MESTTVIGEKTKAVTREKPGALDKGLYNTHIHTHPSLIRNLTLNFDLKNLLALRNKEATAVEICVAVLLVSSATII